MKHQVQQRKFGRVRAQRKALLQSLARALVLEGRIETTESRAKDLRPFVEKMITKAQNDTVANRRTIARRMKNDVHFINTLFTKVAPQYKERAGGYTRITKLPPRSDGTRMAVVEFV